MTALDWVGLPKLWHAGVSHGVLYSGSSAHVWNGLTKVDEPSASSQTSRYMDGVRIEIEEEVEDYEASIESYTYPDILEDSAGKRFSFTYRTRSNGGDKIHIVYNALLNRSSKTHTTIEKQLAPGIFQWNLKASTVNIPGSRPSAKLVVDTGTTMPELVRVVEGWLYGTANSDPHMPEPEIFVDLFEAATTLRITQNKNGTWTAEGPDHIVRINDDGTFDISAPTLQFLDQGVFEIDSF